MSKSKRDKYAMLKRTKTFSSEVTLEFLHDGWSNTYDLVVFEKHFAKKKKAGKRKRAKSPTVLDVKELIAIRQFGKDTQREVNDISLWLLTEELKNDTIVSRLRGKIVTVVIASKAANENLIKVSRHYELLDGRKGQCSFFGRTKFAPAGKWVGLTLWEGKGKNDGSVYGKYYFRCKEGKGLFVRPNKIKKEVVVGKSGIKSKALIDTESFDDIRENYISDSEKSLRMIRSRTLSFEKNEEEMDSDWKPYVSDLKPDHSGLFQKNTLYTKAQLHKNYGERADRKMTIAEFEAWVKDQPGWQAADFKITDTGQSKGLFYTQKKLHSHYGKRASKKLGPQDIGIAEDFDKAEYELNMEDVRYDITHLISKLRKNEGIKAERKPGPQEIGLAEDFEAPTYQLNMDDVRYDLTYTMKKLNENEGKKAARKQGPQDIGRAEDFNEAKYDLNLDDTRYDITYTLKHLHKNNDKRASRRLTLEEIGDNKDYHSYDGPVTGHYDGGFLNDSGKLLYNCLSNLNKNYGVKVDKKKTVEQIGNNLHYKVYDGPVTGTFEGDFLAERDSGYRSSPKKSGSPVRISRDRSSSIKKRKLKGNQRNSALSLSDYSDSNSDR